MKEFDTIAAAATAMSSSGIGIIRISGDEAYSVMQKIFRPHNPEKKMNEQPPHTVHYGTIADGEEILDEVLVMLMKAPHSYTAEDTVEIDCHGGRLVMQRILDLVLRNGARPAQPGEFTKRAFLNGRIDLSQAEAVMDLIQSRNKLALRSSVSQLQGSVKQEIEKLRSSILYETAYLEAALDDPEHISLDGYSEKLLKKVQDICSETEHLVNSSENGRLLREGIKTVILGKPNAGKSSLLNVLLGEERAIVTDIAGTTRDTIEEFVTINGIPLKLIDTAGIRDAKDEVEKIGISKSREIAKDADLIIAIFDSSKELSKEDLEILEIAKNKKSIIILNKMDLETKIDENNEEIKKTNSKIIKISALKQEGIEKLYDEIEKLFGLNEINLDNEVLITNIRHKELISKAIEDVKKAKETVNEKMPLDIIAIFMKNILEDLAQITGEEVTEDIINEIFSKFCLGK